MCTQSQNSSIINALKISFEDTRLIFKDVSEINEMARN